MIALFVREQVLMEYTRCIKLNLIKLLYIFLVSMDKSVVNCLNTCICCRVSELYGDTVTYVHVNIQP